MALNGLGSQAGSHWLARHKHFAPLLGWCLLVFCLSSVPGNKYPQVEFPLADKLVHVGLYFWGGIFAALWYASRNRKLWMAALFCALYGLSDELHQLLVPRRTFSLSDLSADCVGAVSGCVTYAALVMYKPNMLSRFLRKSSVPDTPERMKTT